MDDAITVERLLLRLTMLDLKATAERARLADLTLPQFFALLAAERYPGGASMSQIAGDTLQSPSTLTGIVDRLIERGLVERRRDEGDRRRVRVHPTPAGRELLRGIRLARRQNLAEALRDAPPEQLEQTIRALNRLLKALADQAFPDGAYPPRLLLEDVLRRT